MTPTSEKKSPLPYQKKIVQHWILITILLSLLLLAACRSTPEYSSPAPSPENALVVPSLSPTAFTEATATATATATRASQPTAAQTATPPAIPTATATSTSQPTATQTATPSAIPETTVNVSGYSVNLRTGPAFYFPALQKVPYGETLLLLGRLDDSTWLYVEAPGGQDGWIENTWVDLAGINVDYHPVKTPSPFPEATVKVTASSANLRVGPGLYNFSRIRKVAYGESLTLLGRLSDNSWLYVRTSDGQEGWIGTPWVNITGIYVDYHPIKTPPPTETSTPVVLVGIEGRWIDIDLSEQMLYAYEGTERVASFLVSTGLGSYPTERGQYHINVKWRYADMRGDDYFLPDVPYTMYYYGDFSIHGTYWHHNFGTPMSHGCVNMDISDAGWLFDWASVGTLVNIHR